MLKRELGTRPIGCLSLQTNPYNSLLQTIGGSGQLFLDSTYLAWWSARATEQQSFNEHYRSVTQQLGESVPENRVAAIRELKEIAQHYPYHSWEITELLAILIKQRSPLPPQTPPPQCH